ncbi:hypothetical protein IMSHALPRED_006580 [Imshaugia aleurites]|uniref:Uncharacterized protein n=1 Tax=Imshaugia aleurites TaxID=172621 RepID=A0A8H3EQ07_9LECA|nr:hypothetical protein IMSHALPRED_006580 [Imshaugia aleurites]
MNRSQHIPSDYHEQLSLKDRAVWMLGHRQFFNWQPNETAVQKTGPANAIRRLILDQDFLADIPNDGFSWECGLNDEENVRVRIWYSPCNFSEEEVAAMTRDMLDIAQWLCKVDSWEKKVQVARNGMPK